MYKNIVGICGFAGSGKDTIAGQFLKNGVVRLAFADKLKEVVSMIYGVPLENFHDRELKNKLDTRLSGVYLAGSADPGALRTLFDKVFSELFGSTALSFHAERVFFDLLPQGGCSPREAAQLIGTEGFRAIRDTVWIDYAIRQAVEISKSGKGVVISDVRFRNEADAVRDVGGVILGVTRGFSEKYDHASERSVSEIVSGADYIIENDGTLAELERKAIDFHLDFQSLRVGGRSAFDLVQENRNLLNSLARIRDLFDYDDEMIPSIGDPLEVEGYAASRVDSLKKEVAAWQGRFPEYQYKKDSCISLKSDGRKCGCHCDLEMTQSPDGCVLDSKKPEDCVYARILVKKGQGKESCKYWHPIEAISS